MTTGEHHESETVRRYREALESAELQKKLWNRDAEEEHSLGETLEQRPGETLEQYNERCKYAEELMQELQMKRAQIATIMEHFEREAEFADMSRRLDQATKELRGDGPTNTNARAIGCAAAILGAAVLVAAVIIAVA